MSDELDELLNELIGKEKKPQIKKSEVSSVNQPEEPKKPPKGLEIEMVTEDDAICRCCHTELAPGEKHWLYDDWVERYWWCITCGYEQCNLVPPEA
jgi:hypothetical protein